MIDDTSSTKSNQANEKPLLETIQTLSDSVGNLIKDIFEIIPDTLDPDMLREIISRNFEHQQGFRPEIAKEIAELLAKKIIEERNAKNEG